MSGTGKIFGNNGLIVTGIFILLSYPLFYFSYKFCLPEMGGMDYYSYRYLYDGWKFGEVASPFNMRLISSGCIYLMNQAGFCYNTETIFAAFHPDLSLQVYFNAVLFNYLCVVATCLVIYRILLKWFGNPVYSFLGGCLYLLGFGTLFFSLKPMSDSCGILLVAMSLYFYLQKSYWILPVFLLSVLQREYIFIIFGVVACVDLYFSRNRYHGILLIVSVLCFALYYVLRKTLFFTPQFEFQTSPVTFMQSLLAPDIELLSFFKQTILISNILLTYFLVVLYKKANSIPFNKTHLITVLLLLAQVILMSIMARFGNNAGRYFYFTSPILIFYLFAELKPLVSRHIHFSDHV